MNHPAKQHTLAIGRNRSDVDGALAEIIRRVGVVGAITGLIENDGGATITVKAFDSSDNGYSDTWDALTLYSGDADSGASLAVVPRAKFAFRLPESTKEFVKFEVTPALTSFGRIILSYPNGQLEPYYHEANLPLAPSSLTLTSIDTGEIDLAWTDNSNDEMSFHIERSLNGTTYTELAVVVPGTTSYHDTGLTEGTRYYYRVRAQGNDRYSAYASANAYTFCAAPSNLVATQVTDVRIDLTWDDNSAGETSFKVQRSANGTTGWSTINSPVPDVEAYSNTGLTQNTTYYYRIIAVNAAGDSVPSAVANAITKLATPTVLAAASTVTGRIDLTWTDNASGETGYSVERSDDGATGWAEIATPAANAVSYQNTGVGVGLTKYYRVRATKTGANSAYSNTANATAAA